MNLTKAQAVALGIDANHGAKVKADKQYGSSVCREVLEAVKILTGVEGVLEYSFHPLRLWRFDLAYPEHRIALELNGWTSHHRRGRMEADNVKMASAVGLGWRVFFATVKQAKSQSPLWIAAQIPPPPDHEEVLGGHNPPNEQRSSVAEGTTP